MAVTPGWYPDPEDPAQLRWWDGSSWTDHRRQGLEPAPTPDRGSGTGGEIVPTTTSTNAPVIVGAVVLLTLALVAAGAFWAVGRDDGPVYTWQGTTIADPQLTIDAAEEIFLDGASERNGAVGEESRCYFVRPVDDDDAGTDVADYLRCGPVRFVDGDPDDVWLTYALTAREDDDDGDIHLSTAAEPQSSEPSPLDDDEMLSRPDDEVPPQGDGGLDEPAPPRVEPGFFLADDERIRDVELEDAGASMAGRTTAVTLLGLGEPDRIGVGEDARRPAEDERFIVFDIDITSGDALFGTGDDQRETHISTTATVSLNVDGELTELWGPGSERFGIPPLFITSVPESAETVELVLDDSGVTQRISLLTGEPARSNIRVLTRTERQAFPDATRTIPATITTEAGQARAVDLPVVIQRADLLYHVTENPDVVPSATDKAFLVIRNVVRSPEIGALEAGHLKLEVGGEVIEARNIAPFTGPVVAFEVPADFGTGVLLVGGRARSGASMVDLRDPDFRVPIEIPDA